MPELPEVEAARQAIEEHCSGKKISVCYVANDSKVVEGVTPAELEAALTGKTIIAAHRKGKSLWLRLDSPPFPTFQFGMAGAVYIKGVAVTKYKRSAVSDSDEWPSKYSKVFVKLEDGLEFSFTDKRRFARVRLLEDVSLSFLFSCKNVYCSYHKHFPYSYEITKHCKVQPESVPPISELGPDALLELMSVEEFVDSLSKKKTAIKALLLDQSYISGIGNWLADEVLYQAKIHPLQIASSLSKESCKALHRCIREVIVFSVEVDADSSRFPMEWLFHFRWGKKPGKVNGKKIEFITAGGRTSAYVPELQKLTGDQSEEVSRKKSRKAKPDKNTNKEDEGSGSEEEEYNETVKDVEITKGTKRHPTRTIEIKNDETLGEVLAKKQVAKSSPNKRHLKSSKAKIQQKRA
ncbi:formamidopyrimidine-DNA glycosylase-like isoform X1 [Canna indica]|uniref:Formamidopyrimidine-DNA glycosylase-like isoform X1 n=1 Tax=Canna indica TaxID=4628 RepID=A0AAQ3Q5A8_9LILI|nr:formamidopyrimidine-DNA glycosylase-like isoform X1 [Canna indica]